MYYRPIGLTSRVFTNGPEDRSSIPGRVIPKTPKCYLRNIFKIYEYVKYT